MQAGETLALLLQHFPFHSLPYYFLQTLAGELPPPLLAYYA